MSEKKMLYVLNNSNHQSKMQLQLAQCVCVWEGEGGRK